MATCPICENAFDERGYQLVVPGIGVFDSLACVEEARRRHRRRAREELFDALLAGLETDADGSASIDSPEAATPD